MRLQESLSRLTLLAGLAGVAAMVGYVTLFWDSSQPAVLLRTGAEVAVDFVAEQPRGTVFDDRGVAIRSFQADRLVHFREGDRAELTQPRFQAVGNNGTRWNGVAREGTLLGQENLELRGAVALADAAGTTRVNTERLQWQAEGQRVSSDLAVRLVKDSHIINAVGLRADLDRDRVELLKQVEGIHVVR